MINNNLHMLMMKSVVGVYALGYTLNSIYYWLKLFHKNYGNIYMMYHEAMENLFKQIPTMKSKPLSYDKTHQKILTGIGGH